MSQSKKPARKRRKTRSAKDVAAERATLPTHEEIVFRAYSIYQQRWPFTGDPLSDWETAEHQLLAEHAVTAKGDQAPRAQPARS